MWKSPNLAEKQAKNTLMHFPASLILPNSRPFSLWSKLELRSRAIMPQTGGETTTTDQWKFSSPKTYPADRHLIGCQSASLVRADDWSAAQGLHRRKTPHDCILLGHPAGAQRQASGNDSRKALGNGRHGQGHGDFEVVDRPTEPRATVHGVAEVADVDDPHSYADQGNDLGELLAELIQLLLQRGLLGLGGHHLVPDLPNFRVDPRGDNDTNSFAGSNVGTLEKGKGGA